MPIPATGTNALRLVLGPIGRPAFTSLRKNASQPLTALDIRALPMRLMKHHVIELAFVHGLTAHPALIVMLLLIWRQRREVVACHFHKEGGRPSGSCDRARGTALVALSYGNTLLNINTGFNRSKLSKSESARRFAAM